MTAVAQIKMFGGNAQHTGVYATTPQNLNRVALQAQIDLNNSGEFAHYGQPLVAANNAMFLPVKTATDGFEVDAFQNSSKVYTLTSDYTLPSHDWVPSYQPVLTTDGGVNTRIYYAGAGGAIYYVDNPDAPNNRSQPVQRIFYTDPATYAANAAAYNSSVFVNTPITADSQGDIFFGVRIENTPVAPFTSTQNAYVRMTPDGTSTFVLVGDVSGDTNILRDSHNAAPALSNDEQTLYVIVKGSNAFFAYLMALDAHTLALKSKVFLKDPRNEQLNNAEVLDDSTSSPMVGPDGDVYLGIFANPDNGSRGFLLHFSSDLSVQKTPGAFGWDYTPGIVPASMVPGYQGSSAYLLFCKYNNYEAGSGDGINTVAILDPNSTQIDFHSDAGQLVEMREVMKLIGTTPDSENPTTFDATREWCINSPAINPATGSIFFDSEDGHLYRWDTIHDVLSQVFTLSPGFGEPYVPSGIGADGSLITLDGGQAFSIGQAPSNGEFFTIASSKPDMRTAVSGDSITFTATVHNRQGETGTFTFTDLTYNGLTPFTTMLASNVPVDANGNATVTTNQLVANINEPGSHFITAQYFGGGHTGQVTMVQKVHLSGTTASVTPDNNAEPFGTAFNFHVQILPISSGPPTGYATLFDGNTSIGQIDLSGDNATFPAPILSVGAHTISTYYNSDTNFAASSATITETITENTMTALQASPNPSTFGQNVTLTATVTGVDGGAGNPQGTVTFGDNGGTLGTVALTNGVASLQSSTFNIGTQSLTASFNPTAGWQRSSATATENVTAATTTTASGHPNSSNINQSFTITAIVAAANNVLGIPSGSVVVTVNGVASNPIALNASGQAQLTKSLSVAGSYPVTVQFTGTNGWLNSSGSYTQLVVFDRTAPTTPTGLTATSGPGTGQISIHWNASTDPDDPVDHYEIWRTSSNFGTTFSLAGTTTVPACVDTPGVLQTRKYYVVAVDSHGNHSAQSATVSGSGHP